MNQFPGKKISYAALCAGLFAGSPFTVASPPSDQHIRQIVSEMLSAKDQKIDQLESKIELLERKLNAQAQLISRQNNGDKTPSPETLAEYTERIKNLETKLDASKQDSGSMLSKLEQQVEELVQEASEQGLEITGFFDVSARTEHNSEQTFALGAVEVDLEYAYGEHYAASAALVWDGDDAEIGTAFVDFHMFDNNIPARGRIFNEPGFHVQAGRFDLPFSTDYQYFAAPDRITFSAPLTTERIQQGGFNSDGVRVYGSTNIVNYSAFWTNSVYEDEGMVFGGRVGLALGKNQFQLHRQDSPNIMELGFSHITDLDGQTRARNSVYGADLTFNYGMFQLLSEALWLDSHEDLVDGNDVNHGEGDAFAYHVTLISNLESLTNHPLHVYARFDHWDPDADKLIDADDSTVVYAIENTDRITIGFNYALNDYLQVKFEYSDTIGNDSEEPDFEDELGTAQLVVAF